MGTQDALGRQGQLPAYHIVFTGYAGDFIQTSPCSAGLMRALGFVLTCMSGGNQKGEMESWGQLKGNI